MTSDIHICVTKKARKQERTSQNSLNFVWILMGLRYIWIIYVNQASALTRGDDYLKTILGIFALWMNVYL